MATEFINKQRKAQIDFFARAGLAANTRSGVQYRLEQGRRDLNLSPVVREQMQSYFGPPRNIVWHTHADHGLSSQVCCLNFLGPLATQPNLLAEIIGNALNISSPQMLPIEEGPDGQPWFVGFEWTGDADHLSEWAKGAKKATRGANATSADAIVRFKCGGKIETLLIEWKYTEGYKNHRLNAKGNITRAARYGDKAFAPYGPIRSDLGLGITDFLYEPFYQLMRQQTLAWRMYQAQENNADRVRVLHISPMGNRALHSVTSPALKRFGDDAFEVFHALLVNGDDFVSRNTTDMFGKFVYAMNQEPSTLAWSEYIRDRYGSLFEAA